MSDFRHSFGADDTQVFAVIPGATFLISEMTNYSVSTHIEKKQVRRLGHTFPVGWSEGSGTIAGTLVFAQMTESPLHELRQYDDTIRKLGNVGISGSESIQSSAANILPAQLPPFHLVFIHANDDGQMGVERLYDVSIQSGGKNTGQQNKFTEQHFQYKALYYENLHLMQSLTTTEMAKLAGQEVGFFNDFRRVGSLIDGVAEAVGTDNLADFVSQSTLGNFEAYLEGGDTNPISIADEGAVVFDDSGGDPGTTPETTAPDTETARIKSREWSYPVSDTVVVWDGSSYQTKTVSAQIRVDGEDVYILPDADADPEIMGLVGTLPAGTNEVQLVAQDYYEPLLAGNDLAVSDLEFMPDGVTLEIGHNGAYRSPEFNSVTLEDTALPPEGTYIMADMDYLPDQKLDVARNGDGDLQMEIQENPFIAEGGIFNGSPVLSWQPVTQSFGSEFFFDPDTFSLVGDLSPYTEGRSYDTFEDGEAGAGSPHVIGDGDLKLKPELQVGPSSGGANTSHTAEEAVMGKQWSFDPPLETPEIRLERVDEFVWRPALGYFVDQVSFVHENASTATATTILRGDWRGKDVDLEISGGGSADGTFARVDISGQATGTYFNPISGAGFIEMRINQAGADLRGIKTQIG